MTITYYEIRQDGSIGNRTENKVLAQSLGWTGVTEDNIVDFNNRAWLENELSQNQEYQEFLVQKQKIEANRFILLDITCHYLLI